MITAGGENIAPVPIEEAVKEELGEIVSNVMLVGDHRKHLSVIISLKTELDEACRPVQRLLPSVIQWLREHDCEAETLDEVSVNMSPEVREAIMEAIERANTRAPSRAHRVQKVVFTSKPFMNNTFFLKRF